jgi:Mg2+-importing ATPase
VFKLFIDQALPTTGLSGALAVVFFLEHAGYSKAAAAAAALACLLLDLSVYFFCTPR